MPPPPPKDQITADVAGIEATWDLATGIFRLHGRPAVVLWVDSGLAGLMAGLEAMVGEERFLLALQAEGRRTSHAVWESVREAPSFEEGLKGASRIGRALGWGEVTLSSIDRSTRTCVFRARGAFESLYQKSLGVQWGSGILAGRMAGLCSLYFGTNCWATQTRFEVKGDEYDEFVVAPSSRDVEKEAERLLESDSATRADLAVAVERLRQEVAERTQAEQALRMSEARFSGIVKTALDAIISIDADHRVVVFNAAAERAFGWPAAEVLGRPIEVLLPERFRSAHQRQVADYAINGSSRRTMGTSARVTGVRRNGEEFPAEAYIARAEVAGEQVMTVTLRDLTEQLKQDAEHKALGEQLRHAQRLEAIGTLAGGIAHDFNNVLGAIFGHLDLAERRLETGRSALDDLREIRRASKRARDLVQQILTFSRKAGRAEQVVSINEVVDEVARLLRATLPAHVRLAPRFGSQAANVLADPSELHQVLMNLCTNAWHAIGDRTGTIDVLVDELDCDAVLSRTHRNLVPGRYARITVNDDGAGMDPATLERIFEPFFSTKETGKGTGLGLAVVHGIVEGLNGAIVVQSEPGRGTSFVVYLPSAQAKATPTPVPPPPPALKAVEGSGQRILFVDDEPALIRAYTRVLVSAGFKVTSAPGANEAIALLEATPSGFDLILTDYNMPRRSGFDVARAAASLAPSLPVLLASGFITDEVRRGAAELGIKQLLSKPFSTEDLVAAVLRALGVSVGPPA